MGLQPKKYALFKLMQTSLMSGQNLPAKFISLFKTKQPSNSFRKIDHTTETRVKIRCGYSRGPEQESGKAKHREHKQGCQPELLPCVENLSSWDFFLPPRIKHQMFEYRVREISLPILLRYSQQPPKLGNDEGGLCPHKCKPPRALREQPPKEFEMA